MQERAFVLLAGLPGAGKTTLLRRVRAGGPAAGLATLDAEDVTERLRAGGVLVPYALLRPLVHALHVVRVVAAVAGRAGLVVATDPGTSPLRRGTLVLAARLARRRVRLVLLLATPEQARAGQSERRRAVPARRMGRHEQRWDRLLARVAASGGLPGADEVVLLRRDEAAALAGAGVLAALRPADRLSVPA